MPRRWYSLVVEADVATFDNAKLAAKYGSSNQNLAAHLVAEWRWVLPKPQLKFGFGSAYGWTCSEQVNFWAQDEEGQKEVSKVTSNILGSILVMAPVCTKSQSNLFLPIAW